LTAKEKPRSFYLEGFSGLGIRSKSSYFLTHEGFVYEEERIEYVERFEFVVPSLHVGIRLGVDWQKRERSISE
ncbi:MAG: hypothetical protein M3R08_02690, partial [Bacteroidota bacterium]|nr:hypothetical protein [Bacteroidota bacterium]